MQSLAKIAAGLVVAFVLGVGMASVHEMALLDALGERLDATCLQAVSDYLRSTRFSRWVGFTLLFVVWTMVVIAIDKAPEWVRRRGYQSTDR